ncbi:P-type conjugative transfer protein TrbL [Rudaea sp.]|uniref:P-type conjugative transfer protein TrbL n=1 Tax=Rudaea sp. TaxID=2136325 RepID=UPI003783E976
MTPNAGILTQLLQSFLNVFNGGWASLQPSAMSLFHILVGIELTLSGLWWAMSGNDAIKSLIQKLLVIGLFFFFIQQWQTVTTTTLQSFARAGATAGGGNLTALSDPSTIVAEGLNAIQPISDKVDALTQGTWTALKNLGTIMQLGLAMIGILFAFFLLGIQCFLTYVEFYIVAILSLILVPFGVFRHTAFLAEKAFGAVIAHGVKLMVLAFIVAIAQPVLAQITLSVDFSMRDAWCTLLAAMAICFLAWHAPGMAAGLLAGSPTLSAGQAIGGALETGGAMALGAAGVAAAGRSLASGVGSTIEAASALKTGASVGASRAAEAGAGPLGQAAGAVGGAANVAMSPITQLGERMRQRVADGQVAGLAANGLDPSPKNESGSTSSTEPSGFRAADGGAPTGTTHPSPPSAAFSSPQAAGSQQPNAAPHSSAQPEQATAESNASQHEARSGDNTDALAPSAAASADTLEAARVAPGRRRVDDDATQTLGPTSATVTTLDAARVAPSLRRVDDTTTEGFQPRFAAGVRDSATESAARADDDLPALPTSDDTSPTQE